ncbi:MAG: HD-GYP domain-containing protein [Burkholderiales bacterium]|nr:HD-GYP domain-containing protein [Burkholderiales bacterium]
MLRKVTVDQLALGMHLHALCGSWLSHPFWRTKFLLRDPADLAKIRASGVVECWIDTDKGNDVRPASVLPEPPTAAAPALAAPPAPSDTPARPAVARVSIDEEAARAGALCRQSKQQVEALFGDARMGRALDAEQCLPLVDEIASSVERNPGALISLARLKTHDNYSYMHSVAVCALMVSLSRQLGHDEAAIRAAGLAGLLHDIGKAVMPLDLLNKPGSLTGSEYAVIKTHPERGAELLVEGRGATPIAIDVCLHHHERPDGTGYPHGLGAAALSLHARMGAVCDVYDAITSDRPYKAGWDPSESIARMSDWTARGQFDPAVFGAFIECVGIYPIGSLVRLQSGRLAVVVEQTAGSAMTPRVRVFFSTRSRMPVPLELLDLSQPRCNDRILKSESNEEWSFPHLAELAGGPPATPALRATTRRTPVASRSPPA